MKYLFLAVLLILVGLIALPHLGTPRHDRDWAEPYEKTPNALVSTSTVRLFDVRNFNHSATSTISREWLDEVEISVEDVSAVWFGLARFESWAAVGHSFLSFELKDGTVYTLSIEARRETDETYSSFKGLFNNFELWYGWGTERDFLGVSLFTLNRPLEYYRLDLSEAEAQAVFRSVALETARVAAEPQFYHTLSANCTNLLAKAVNEHYPGRLPYGLAWNLPGKSVEYLWDEGLIDETIQPSEHREQASVDATDPELTATIETTPKDFSQTLRMQLQTESDI